METQFFFFNDSSYSLGENTTSNIKYVAIQDWFKTSRTQRHSRSIQFPSSHLLLILPFVQKKPLIYRNTYKRTLCLLLSLILEWFDLSRTTQYFFLIPIFFRASVEIVPSTKHFVNPENPVLRYIDFLLLILEPYLNQICLWVSHLSPQSQYSFTLQKSVSELLLRMGRRESDAIDLLGTSYPGSWTTDINGADEPRLCKAYSIPSSVQLRLDTKDMGATICEDKYKVCV